MKLATRIFVLLLVLGCYLTATGFFFETMLCFPDKVWGISMMAPLFLVGTFTFVVLDINERAHLQPLQCCRDFLSVCSCTCCCDDGGHVSGSSRDKQRSKFIFTFNMSLVMVAMTLILYLGGKHQIPGPDIIIDQVVHHEDTNQTDLAGYVNLEWCSSPACTILEDAPFEVNCATERWQLTVVSNQEQYWSGKVKCSHLSDYCNDRLNQPWSWLLPQHPMPNNSTHGNSQRDQNSFAAIIAISFGTAMLTLLLVTCPAFKCWYEHDDLESFSNDGV